MDKNENDRPAFTKTTKYRFVARLIARARSLQKTDYEFAVIVIVGLALAIMVRYSLLGLKTLDYNHSYKIWYDIIKSRGLSAFATNFSDYNPPYLYILYLIARLFPDMSTIIAVKLSPLFADFILAYIAFRTVQIKYPNSLSPLLAGMAVLFAPTVVLNSAFWGQADSLFTTGLMACLFLLLIQKNGWAMLAFGVALAFKLQAIFLIPLLLALLLRGTIHWKYFLIIPAVLILALIPSWVAGRPIQNLINIYLSQASQFELLTINAPSLYAWLPATKKAFNLFYTPGVIVGAISAYLFFLIVYKSPQKLTRASIVELSLLVMLIIPFFLPKMHERYFYPADVISIVFAFYFPRFYYIPVLIGGASFFAYQPYLFNIEQIPMPILTAILLIVICILTYHILISLYFSEAKDSSALNNSLLNESNNRTQGELNESH